MVRSLLLFAAAIVAAALTAATASAAPVNDQLANATVLPSSGSQWFTATTAGASTEAGEPDLYSMHRTVWFRWTAAVTGGTYVAGCPGDADIDVYTGSTIGTLSRVSGGGAKCSGDAKWPAQAGVTYRIRVNAHTIAAGGVETIQLKQVTAKPDAAMIDPPAVTSITGKLMFKETTGAEGPVHAACDIDGKPQSCYVEGDHFVLALQEAYGLTGGTHVLHVTLTDFYDNDDPTPLAYAWKVDATSPVTSLVGQPDPASGTPQLSFASNEPGATFECRLDASLWVPCASPWTMSVGYGGHIAYVRALDAVGNADQTPESVTWTRKAPETPKPPVTVTPVVRPAPVLAAPGPVGTTGTASRPTTAAPVLHAAGCRVAVGRPTTLTRRVLRGGLHVKVTAQAGCRWTLTLRRHGSAKALASAKGTGGGPAQARTLKPTRRAAARIATGARLDLVAQATGTPGASRTVSTLVVRR